MRQCIALACALAALSSAVSGVASAQVSRRDSVRAVVEDSLWQPTGEWPFVNRRFMPAEVVTGLFTFKKTIVPCNIHIGNQALYYMEGDTVKEADPVNVNFVRFRNGDVYQPVGNTFAKVVRNDTLVGKVLRVRTVDKERFEEEGRAVSNLGTVSLGGGAFGGVFNMDFSGQYDVHPEENPLPLLDTFYFIYDKEIFLVTDKEILKRIDQKRRREYRDFTRRAEILLHTERSVLRIWDTFFVNR